VKKHVGLAAYETFSLILVLMALTGCSTGRVDREQSSATSMAAGSGLIRHPLPSDTQITRANYPTNLATYIPPPNQMVFCGEAVPLDNQQVWERFDREFTIVVYNNAQMYLWVKRMHRDFPWIEKRLQMLSLPDDLKYFIVEETDLLPRVWLAKIGTVRSTGLSSPASGYSQNDYEQALDLLLFKLKALRGQFPSWTLAIAAYYSGEKRLHDAITEQKINDFYPLQLPLATETNVFRIIAIKAALKNPELYGYVLPLHARY